MALIQPFRALRPTPENAAAVSSVPYDVVNTDEARELASGNPLSFLHVTRSEIDLPPAPIPTRGRCTNKRGRISRRCVQRAPLVIDEVPALYFYRLRMGAHEQTGIAGCFSLDEYESDVIKKHERTRRDKEDDRTRHMVELRAQTGVVFLTYRADRDGRRAGRGRSTAGEPLYDFTAPDGVRHTIWRAGLDQTRGLVAAFAAIPALYIADGHHRAASAARAARNSRTRRVDGDEAGADTFIAVAFPDNQVQILAYNRTVKDLGGRDAAPVSRRRCGHSSGSPTARRRPNGRARSRCTSTAAGTRSTSPSVAPADDSRGSSLDVSRLQRGVLEPIC